MNCGTVIVGKDNSAQFYLTKISDISTNLIPLFEKFPLNGIKYLDYLCFKEGVSLKLNGSLDKGEQLRLITSFPPPPPKLDPSGRGGGEKKYE